MAPASAFQAFALECYAWQSSSKTGLTPGAGVAEEEQENGRAAEQQSISLLLYWAAVLPF
jgi:hypothetical protein